jgi:hypothetical protein
VNKICHRAEVKIIFFAWFWFGFHAVIDQNGSYFAFAHGDVRINPNVSFRYRNELKIRLDKRMGFMHVDITSSEL